MESVLFACRPLSHLERILPYFALFVSVRALSFSSIHSMTSDGRQLHAESNAHAIRAPFELTYAQHQRIQIHCDTIQCTIQNAQCIMQMKPNKITRQTIRLVYGFEALLFYSFFFVCSADE